MTANGGIILKSAKATNGMVHVVDRLLYNIPRVPADRFVQESYNASNFRMLMQYSESQSSLRGIYKQS